MTDADSRAVAGPSGTLLAADVGASKTRVRLARGGAVGRGFEVLAETEFESGPVPELEQGILEFAAGHGAGDGLAAVVVGLPGKISEDRQSAAITYLDPAEYVSFAGLFARLNVRRGLLMNDLECGTWAIPSQPASALVHLAGPEVAVPRRCERFVLGMPGTGFGVGLQLRPGFGFPSEGGHLLAATGPVDEIEQDLRTRFSPDPPSYEDLVRGSAIPVLFEAILHRNADAETRAALLTRLEASPAGERPRWVERLAQATGDPGAAHARQAFDYYGRFLGRAMQSFALLTLPEALFLGGAVVIGTHRLFARSFLESFRRHRIHSDFLTGLPVIVALNPALNLDGATEAALRL